MIALACLLLLAACAQTTVITQPDGDEYTVTHSRDAIVEFTDGDERVTVDDRGREGVFESLTKIWMLRWADEEGDE